MSRFQARAKTRFRVRFQTRFRKRFRVPSKTRIRKLFRSRFRTCFGRVLGRGFRARFRKRFEHVLEKILKPKIGAYYRVLRQEIPRILCVERIRNFEKRNITTIITITITIFHEIWPKYLKILNNWAESQSQRNRVLYTKNARGFSASKHEGVLRFLV